MIILTQEIIQKVTDNNALAVLIRSIAMRANNNQTCFPSLNKICQDTNLSKPTVIKALNYLVEKGVIEKKNIHRENAGYSNNIYTICTEEIKIVKGVKLGKKEVKSGKEFLPPLVNSVDHPSKPILPPLVNSVDSNSQEQINSQENITQEKDIKENQLSDNRVDQFISNPDFEQNHKTRFPNYSIDEIRLLLTTYFADYPKSKNTIVYNFLSETYRKEGKKWDKKPESNEPTVQDIHDKYNITF
jgi:hypothetical protein